MWSFARRRLWIEASLAMASGLFFALTLAWPDWIELVFGADPDRGDGSVEWAILALSLMLCLFSLVLGRAEWRRVALERKPVEGEG